jgi:hypothetical protein
VITAEHRGPRFSTRNEWLFGASGGVFLVAGAHPSHGTSGRREKGSPDPKEQGAAGPAIRSTGISHFNQAIVVEGGQYRIG